MIASLDGDCCVVLNESEDSYIGCCMGEGPDLIDLYLPSDLVTDPVAGELASLWCYLYLNEFLTNCSIDVFCVRKQTWLSLKKSRVKHDLLAILLRQIFWWSMERNVNLCFFNCPLT